MPDSSSARAVREDCVEKVEKAEPDRSQQGPIVILILCIILTAFLAVNRPDFPEFWMLRVILAPPLVFMSVHTLYYVCRIHEKYGFFKVQEPPYHYWFAMKTVWIVLLWGIGQVMLLCLLGCSGRVSKSGFLLWKLPEKYIFLHADTTSEQIVYAVIGFYVTDFCRYWGHRIGHWGVFYKSFPFGHFQHHNQVFLSPFVTFMTSFFHLTALGSFLPMVFMFSQGLNNPAFWIDIVMNFTNVTMHLGFDPFPWLTRWSHFNYGLLPWIPHYHQYHHIPFLKAGNFGNSTMVWDYVFGTLLPESIEHIETGKMPQKVLEKMQSENLSAMLEQKLRNRNKLDLNQGSGSIFNLQVFN